MSFANPFRYCPDRARLATVVTVLSAFAIAANLAAALTSSTNDVHANTLRGFNVLVAVFLIGVILHTWQAALRQAHHLREWEERETAYREREM